MEQREIMYIRDYSRPKKELTFKEFYEKYCKNCRLEENPEADPICKDLENMMEGGKTPSECEKFKRSGKNNE